MSEVSWIWDVKQVKIGCPTRLRQHARFAPGCSDGNSHRREKVVLPVILRRRKVLKRCVSVTYCQET